MSASMGYEELAKISHRMEDYLDQFRGGAGTLERRGIDLLFEGVDLLRGAVEEIAEGRPPSASSEEYQAKMAAVLVGASPGGPPPAPSVKAPAPPSAPPAKAPPPPAEPASSTATRFAVQVRFVADAPLPAARAYITLRRVRDLGELLRSAPSPEEVQAGRFSGTLSMLIASTRSAEDVKSFMSGLPDVASVLVRAAPEASEPSGDLPGPILAAASAPAEAPVAKPEPPPPPGAPEGGTPPPARRTASMMRVDTRLLDDLMDQVGELVTANGHLEELSHGIDSAFLHESAGRVGSLAKSLQQQALKLRMMPLEMIADRFPRAVRDIARKRGKEVVFEVAGKEIEMDRSVLEELPDPILHILRNCVDHGIEPAEERVRAGKPPAGTIRVEATKERESIVIRVSDDGRGMDPARFRRVALERGVITREQHDRLSDPEALSLITLPGFSTATAVSDVSGRGVGMDVVRSTVESLHGSLLIDSVVGRGSTITLRLPLTLAVVAVLLVEVSGERYALPIASVEETLEVRAEEVQRSQGMELVAFDEGLIPLLPLGQLVGAPQPPHDPQLVVVCEMRQRLTGLAVDRLIGYREVVVKPLDKALRGIRGLAGATILGDGTPVLILDLNTF
jgi:two-component system chemotaxis sensor kinase CheA